MNDTLQKSDKEYIIKSLNDIKEATKDDQDLVLSICKNVAISLDENILEIFRKKNLCDEKYLFFALQIGVKSIFNHEDNRIKRSLEWLKSKFEVPQIEYKFFKYGKNDRTTINWLSRNSKTHPSPDLYVQAIENEDITTIQCLNTLRVPWESDDFEIALYLCKNNEVKMWVNDSVKTRQINWQNHSVSSGPKIFVGTPNNIADLVQKKMLEVQMRTLSINKTIETKKKQKEKKPKKKHIPISVKRKVWSLYIGDTIGKTKCLCCKNIDIQQISFHCGHVISEHDGGETTVENLRPICSSCNSSMGTKNMNSFIKEFGF